MQLRKKYKISKEEVNRYNEVLSNFNHLLKRLRYSGYVYLFEAEESTYLNLNESKFVWVGGVGGRLVLLEGRSLDLESILKLSSSLQRVIKGINDIGYSLSSLSYNIGITPNTGILLDSIEIGSYDLRLE